MDVVADLPADAQAAPLSTSSVHQALSAPHHESALGAARSFRSCVRPAIFIEISVKIGNISPGLIEVFL
ncbi:hypothetical protein ABZ470_21435 [Streptosporangium sp. NPDC020072]|uniref:hypothetical protein n=1 Tax=Streptosporangium sp. NPDC020072 TaxID=3154788 RepID=UPI00341378A9